MIILLLLFVLKHFTGDFLFQLDGSSGRKRLDGWRGTYATGIHSLHHGILTFAVVLLWLSSPVISMDSGVELALSLGLLDFGTHFAIDFAKVGIEKELTHLYLWSDVTPKVVPFRKTLIIVDQLLHFLVYGVIMAILSEL